MSKVEVLQEKVQQLRGFYDQRKSYEAQIKDNIEKLKSELKNVSIQLVEVLGGIQAYNESIRVLQEETNTASSTVEAVVEGA